MNAVNGNWSIHKKCLMLIQKYNSDLLKKNYHLPNCHLPLLKQKKNIITIESN